MIFISGVIKKRVWQGRGSVKMKPLRLETQFKQNDVQQFIFRGGSQARKHVFEITVEPKVPPIVPTFWLGLEVPDPFPAKNKIFFI